jgi:hypothetical protein
MMSNWTQLLYSYITPTARTCKSAAAKNYGEDPKTLFEMLQRVARLWPNRGIAFKDQGWDHKSDFLTYADLLREAEVTLRDGEEGRVLTDARSTLSNYGRTRLSHRRSV